MSVESMLQVEDLAGGYGDTAILHGVDLQVHSGVATALRVAVGCSCLD